MVKSNSQLMRNRMSGEIGIVEYPEELQTSTLYAVRIYFNTMTCEPITQAEYDTIFGEEE